MRKHRKSASVWVATGEADCERRQARRLGSQGVRSHGFLLAFVVLLAAISPGCKPFKVKPRIVVPGADNASKVEANGITIAASVVRDEDWLNDTFDANLILCGIVPLRVEVKNAGQIPLDLGKMRFELKSGAGRSFGSVGPDRAFKQALTCYDVSAWSKALYKESRADFSSYGLDFKTPAPAGESRTGLIYFLVPGDAAREIGFTLVVTRLPGAKGDGRAELRLD